MTNNSFVSIKKQNSSEMYERKLMQTYLSKEESKRVLTSLRTRPKTGKQQMGAVAIVRSLQATRGLESTQNRSKKAGKS